MFEPSFAMVGRPMWLVHLVHVNGEFRMASASCVQRSFAGAANPEDRSCRICFDGNDAHTLIAPCLCKGSSRWIHRGCLNEVRAATPTSATRVLLTRPPFVRSGERRS